ncbi:MAG: YkgJ family cysteine cluster protein [Siphonobacter aquaeclarae]|jgi:Fe-S-cluster containining protein|nr:YkgJ family cysteine cluster protein [Siphonobacter aquaeclarae]
MNERYAEHKRYLNRLKARKPKKLDEAFEALHEEVFEETDCLTCANCCKTTSPIFTDADIERIAKHLKMRPADFIGKYLHLDEDRHYVLNSSPCFFLDAENYCAIYDVRPKACREYPHTNRRRMHQILDLTLANTHICPAVAEVVERLQKVIPA